MRSKVRPRILITGGAGFIGSHLARRALRLGYRVWIIDDFSTGDSDNIPVGADVVCGDVADAATFARLPAGKFAGVFHLAAQSSGEISHTEPERDLRTNVLGTLQALRWAQARRAGRFMFSSSMAVYGEPKIKPVTEETPCAPLSPYGVAKRCAELYCENYARHGLPVTVFRLFSVYGPGQNLRNMKQGMVSIYLAYLRRGQAVKVKGDLRRFRDFVYIDDVVDAWLAAFHSARCVGKTLNIGGGHKTTVRDLLAAEMRAWGSSVPVRIQAGTPDDQFGLYADMKRTRSCLRWRPKVNLDEGLRCMVDWARGISANGHDKQKGAGA